MRYNRETGEKITGSCPTCGIDPNFERAEAVYEHRRWVEKNKAATRIAPDGKLYDKDELNREPKDNEVEIIQFLRPDGERRYMLCEVPEDVAKLSRDMIISAEELRMGEIAIYAHYKDEDEENEIMELASNGPGENNPREVLVKVINRKGEIK